MDEGLFALVVVGDEALFMYLYLLFIHKLHTLQACLNFGVICVAHQMALANQIHDYVI